jgi:hypothetical protein
MAEKGDRDAALGNTPGETQWPEPTGDDAGARRLRARYQRGDQDRSAY